MLTIIKKTNLSNADQDPTYCLYGLAFTKRDFFGFSFISYTASSTLLTVSADGVIEPRPAATIALAARRSNCVARDFSHQATLY